MFSVYLFMNDIVYIVIFIYYLHFYICIFFKTQIYVSGFCGADLEKLRKIINIGGGTR